MVALRQETGEWLESSPQGNADRLLLLPDVPSWFSMSATSSLFTTPSLSRSRIWKPSRSVRTCGGCSCDSALPWPMGAVGAAEAPREPRDARGDPSMSAAVAGSCGVSALGVMLSAVLADGVDTAAGEANRELALA